MATALIHPFQKITWISKQAIKGINCFILFCTWVSLGPACPKLAQAQPWSRWEVTCVGVCLFLLTPPFHSPPTCVSSSIPWEDLHSYHYNEHHSSEYPYIFIIREIRNLTSLPKTNICGYVACHVPVPARKGICECTCCPCLAPLSLPPTARFHYSSHCQVEPTCQLHLPARAPRWDTT
jgi:hypothetical protein